MVTGSGASLLGSTIDESQLQMVVVQIGAIITW